MFVFEHFVNISFNALEKFIHCYDLSVNTPVFRQEEAGKETPVSEAHAFRRG